MDGERTSGSFGTSDVSAPGCFESLSSGIDGLVYVFGRSGVEVEQVLAGRRVDGRKGLSIGGRHEFVVARDSMGLST